MSISVHGLSDFYGNIPVQQGVHHKLIPVLPGKDAQAEWQGGTVHRTLDEECLNARAFRKSGPRDHAIRRWLRFYNTQRPHSALAWLTPLQKLQSFTTHQSVTHV